MKANKTKKAAILLAVTMVGSFSLSACTQRANLDDGAIEALEAIESAAETSSLEEESEDTKSESKYSIATQDAKDSADSKSTTSGSVKATETETSKASSAKKETTAKADKETSKAESEAAAKDSKTESSVSAESESAEPVPAIHEPEATPAATQALATQPAAPAATEAPETWGEWQWSGWTVVKAATCTAEGSQQRTATRTSNKGRTETKTETAGIPAKGHSYKDKVVAPTEKEQGYTLHTCSVCGSSYKDNYTPKVDGPETWGDWQWSEWEVIDQPTCIYVGYRMRTGKRVSSLGRVETKEEGEDIPWLGHAYGETVVERTYEHGGYTLHTCSRCGYSYKSNETPPKEDPCYRRDIADEVLALITEIRAAEGLNTVISTNPANQAWADKRAKELVQEMSHKGGVAENIACGMTMDTAQEAVDTWMSSPGHKYAILHNEAMVCSVYYDPDSTNKYYYVLFFNS